eukprot:16075-Hanusia_phi.AAC.2
MNHSQQRYLNGEKSRSMQMTTKEQDPQNQRGASRHHDGPTKTHAGTSAKTHAGTSSYRSILS